MKTSVLLFGALTAPLACEKTQLCGSGQAQSHLIAALQAGKAPTKQPCPAPSEPAKKPAPKERDTRPNPPGHLFM